MKRTGKPIFVSFLFLLNGCALLGNIKPVDEKSGEYGVVELSRENPEWVRLSADESGFNSKEDTSDERETQVTDVAFQSKKTASIVSLNSACRSGGETTSRDLRSSAALLVFGLSDVSQRDEKQMNVQNVPALQTTVRGKFKGEDTMIRTVVLKHHACNYDLIYIARPEHFAENENDFLRFVSSLKLK